MSRTLPFLLLGLATTGCATGDRRIETVHQPLVANGRAIVPNCPDWSDAGRPAREGQSSNFGCATKSNLAAMIADPADLVRGRADEGSTAERAGKAIKAWREAEPSAKAWVTTTSNSVGAPK